MSPDLRLLWWDRSSLLSIMCCLQVLHDDQGKVEPSSCARCYRITGTSFNGAVPEARERIRPDRRALGDFRHGPGAGAGEALLPDFRGQVGRPEEDSAALARAFMTKAAFDVATTRALIDCFQVDDRLRRLYGWSGASRLPSEATFSRALFPSSPRAVCMRR